MKKLHLHGDHGGLNRFPEVVNPHAYVVNSLQQCLGENTVSGLLMLGRLVTVLMHGDGRPELLSKCLPNVGAAVLSLHYDQLLKRFGSVGIHIAYGKPSRGKSLAAKVAIAACCNYP